MFTVSAEGESVLTDNVKHSEWVDHFGNEIELFAGDLNTDSADPAGELAAFKNAGFTLGNFGDFGTFQTYRYGGAGDKYLDNIVVKGLEMKNFWVGEETYSDHFPVYSEIYLPLKND